MKDCGLRGGTLSSVSLFDTTNFSCAGGAVVYGSNFDRQINDDTEHFTPIFSHYGMVVGAPIHAVNFTPRAESLSYKKKQPTTWKHMRHHSHGHALVLDATGKMWVVCLFFINRNLTGLSCSMILVKL